MKDEDKTRQQLLQDLGEMRRRMFEMELADAGRRRAEDALLESEERYRALVESINDVIFTLDAQGRLSYISPVIEQVSGYKVNEVEGQPFTIFVHPEDLPGLMASMTLTLDGRLEPHEFRVLNKDGGIRHVRTSSRPLFEAGEPVGLTGVMTDITERRRAEKELARHREHLEELVGERTAELQATNQQLVREIDERRRAEEQLLRQSSAVRMSTDSIVLSDVEGKITEVNQATLTMYGTQDEEDLIGKSAFDLIAPEDRERALAGLEEVLEKGYVKSREYQIITREGKRIPVEMSAAIIRDAGGESVGFVGISRDITERRRAEEELEAFAHTISHDLYGPLASIIGFTQEALRASGEGNRESEGEYLGHVVSAAHRMKGFIDSLLQYAQAGRPEGEIARVETEEVLLEVLMDLEESILEKEVEMVIEDDLPAILVDDVKLHQVLSNLVGNAVKYLGDDNPLPSVEIGAIVEGDSVTLHVKDNGVGIPRSGQEAVFEPFRRFEAMGIPGLGIGLSTVKRAVEAWGGKVWVESVPGEGSTFFFTAKASEP